MVALDNPSSSLLLKQCTVSMLMTCCGSPFQLHIVLCICRIHMCVPVICRRLSGVVEVIWSSKTSSNVCLMDAALPSDATLDQTDPVDQSSKDKKKKNM